MNNVLNLDGKFRRRGYPLFLTTEGDVEDCSSYSDYVRKLALGNTRGPAFRFNIGTSHIGVTPNVRAGESDHDSNDTMSVHEPTVVDGMWYDSFIAGGFTSGGAREYVSKLDNTEAIDSLEMIE